MGGKRVGFIKIQILGEKKSKIIKIDWECGGNEKIKKSVYTQQKKYLEI